MHCTLRNYRWWAFIDQFLDKQLKFSADILVDVVDDILEGSGIDEKFLGVTLFALVPNTTEFMNAISFALNGNIALRCVQQDVTSKANFNVITVWR